MDDIKICGVVVWYNPEPNDILNINSYVNSLDYLYVIDNSDVDNESLLSLLPDEITDKICYVANCDNLGIATALNIGCRKAIDNQFKFVLTMDQDSMFESDQIVQYFTLINVMLRDIANHDISVFAPSYSPDNTKFGFVNSVITSGNVISLPSYEEVNGFDDELFIDQVDHDFCYKLIEAGKKIYMFPQVSMSHTLGDSKVYKIFNKNIVIMNHNHIRKYYIIRNRLYIRQKYPQFTKNYFKSTLILIYGVIFYEKNKLIKLKFMIKGVADFIFKVKGRLS
jgi:rhamnosyltransferase